MPGDANVLGHFYVVLCSNRCNTVIRSHLQQIVRAKEKDFLTFGANAKYANPKPKILNSDGGLSFISRKCADFG